MNGERWFRVQEIFHSAADLEPQERSAFLNAACCGDAELRVEVEALLSADDSGDAGLWEAIQSEAGVILDTSLLPGHRVGAYRVIREVGRGGMGAVYLAERDDDQYHKQVAIKVVRRGMDTVDLLGRFRTERQILANLEHPYIARLLDGGSTVDGRPFFVMEFVEGQPIDEYCRERDLNFDDRCRLFLKVCEAVAHAHRSLVVHRDLKPANILIPPEGSPKLLDFGVAKILAADSDGGPEFTTTAARALTPDYASPEQVRGTAISTAVDVYSLGAILYELLTGARPHRITSSNPAEWERVICDTEIERPSVAVQESFGGTRWRRQLAGDLDNIVLMAMRKEASRRYASVDHLAEDIQRYLDCKPVIARADSWRYRAMKFARRERYALAAGALVALSLLSGTWVAVAQARKATAARRIAEGEAHRADQRLAQLVELSNRSLTDLYSTLEKLPGTAPARRQVIGSAVDLLQKLAADAGQDRRLRLTLSQAYLRLGEVQGDVNVASSDPRAALESYRAGAALVEPFLPPAPGGVGALPVWIDLQQRTGSTLLAIGRTADASSVLSHALDTSDKVISAPDAGRDLLRRHAALYLAMARVAHQDDPGAALAFALRYLDRMAELVRRFPQDPDLQIDLSSAHLQVGYELIFQNRPQSGVSHYERMLSIREAVAKAHPGDFVYRRALMMAYQHVAGIHGSPLVANLGHTEIAREYYRRARPMFEEAYAASPDDVKFYYADFLLRSAALDVPPERLAESLSTLRKAAALFESFRAAEPEVVSYRMQLAIAREYLGHRLLKLGQPRAALDEYRKSVSLGRELALAGKANQEVLRHEVDAHRGVVRALLAAGDSPAAFSEARTLLAQVQAQTAETSGAAERLAGAHLTLAEVYRTLGDRPHARQEARKSLAQLHNLPIATRRPLPQKLLAEAEAMLQE